MRIIRAAQVDGAGTNPTASNTLVVKNALDFLVWFKKVLFREYTEDQIRDLYNSNAYGPEWNAARRFLITASKLNSIVCYMRAHDKIRKESDPTKRAKLRLPKTLDNFLKGRTVDVASAGRNAARGWRVEQLVEQLVRHMWGGLAAKDCEVTATPSLLLHSTMQEIGERLVGPIVYRTHMQ